MIKVKGDLVEAFKNNELDVIAHQVNCKGVMGGGIARQIRDNFPAHYNDYLEYIVDLEKIINDSGQEMKSKYLLGGVAVTTVSENKTIACIFGQDEYGGTERNTNYAALMEGLTFVARESYARKLKVGIPKYIGCGLGGGSWDIVSSLILDLEESTGIEFHMYEL
jgi:O-acetyl-ADP-ribose deacetylase (regulator of RNase III)